MTMRCGIFNAIWLSVAMAALFCMFPRGVCHDDLRNGFDFQLRYNETKCVLNGVDPFLLWSGVVDDGCHIPWNWSCADKGEVHEFVHCYPPWTYTYLMPLALLPKRYAATVWLAFEVVCAVGLFVFAFWIGMHRTMSFSGGACSLAVSAAALPPVIFCIKYLNFGLPIAVLLLIMIYCLNRHSDLLAGVCWALMMVKPQIALLFVIPLLVGRKFKTIFVAMVICFFATVLPSVLCHRSPVDMLLSVLKCNDAFAAGGRPICFFVDIGMLSHFGHHVKDSIVLVVDAAVAVLLCFLMSWFLRKYSDWMVRVLPAVLLCFKWSVFRPHDLCVLVPAMALLCALLMERRNVLGMRLVLLVLVMIDMVFTFLTPALIGWIGLPSFILSAAVAFLFVYRKDIRSLIWCLPICSFAAVLAFSPVYMSHIYYLAVLPILYLMVATHSVWELLALTALLFAAPKSAIGFSSAVVVIAMCISTGVLLLFCHRIGKDVQLHA